MLDISFYWIWKTCLLKYGKILHSIPLVSSLSPVLTLSAHQAPLSMELSRQEHWSGLPFPSPADLINPGIEPQSPAWQADSLPLSHLASHISDPNVLIATRGTSLVIQWLRPHLPMQGVPVQFLGELRSTCLMAKKDIKQKQYCSKFNKDFKYNLYQ